MCYSLNIAYVTMYAVMEIPSNRKFPFPSSMTAVASSIVWYTCRGSVHSSLSGGDMGQWAPSSTSSNPSQQPRSRIYHLLVEGVRSEWGDEVGRWWLVDSILGRIGLSGFKEGGVKGLWVRQWIKSLLELNMPWGRIDRNGGEDGSFKRRLPREPVPRGLVPKGVLLPLPP